MISFVVNKESFLKKINLASRFTKSTMISSLVNQGFFFEIKNKKINIITTNFSSFFKTSIDLEKKEGENTEFILEIKKLTDFVNYLPSQKIRFLIDEKKVVVGDEVTKGVFQKVNTTGFPKLPLTEEKDQKVDLSLWQKKLPQVLFCSSSDDSRPAITGVYLTTKDDSLVFVATDGFRLSLYSFEKMIDLPPMIIPTSFLEEVLRAVEEKEVRFGYSLDEKVMFLKTKEDIFISRLINADFPPYEKVIPQEKRTSFVLFKEDFFRKLKTISVFTRETSNVVVFNITKKEIVIKPKNEEENETEAHQEIFDFQGESIKIAFNIRFLMDFLSRFQEEELIVEVFKPEAPVVFKGKKDENFLHIIMPVRISE